MNKQIMTPETKHLLKWWKEWGKRFLLTSYHLINRKAYRKWKLNRKPKMNKKVAEVLFEDWYNDDVIFEDLRDFH